MNKEQQRFETAKAAMQAILSRSGSYGVTPQSVAGVAVAMADALLAELYPAGVELRRTDADGWIAHDPKDPVPKTVSAVKFKDGMSVFDATARAWLQPRNRDAWDHTYHRANTHITHYKP